MADNQGQSQPQSPTSDSSDGRDSSVDDVGTVEVHEATDSELDAAFDEIFSGSDDGIDEEADGSEEDFEGEEDDSEPASSNEGDNGSPDVSEQPSEGGESEDDLRLQIRALQDSHAQLVKQLTSVSKQQENQSQFIARRETELGQLRKNIKTLEGQLQHKLESEGDILPVREQVEITAKLKELKERDEDAQYELSKIRTQKVVEELVEPYEEMVHDMLYVMNHDYVKRGGKGLDRSFAESFMRDPYGHAGPDAFVHLAHRAKLTRENALLMKKVKELEEQVQKQKSSPREAIKKVNSALKSTPTHLRGSEGRSSNGISALSQSDLARMSEKQLAELETQLGLR